MTRKDYQAFADAIKQVTSGLDSLGCPTCCFTTREAVDAVTHKLADIFAHDNSRFDRDRFIQACMPKGGN